VVSNLLAPALNGTGIFRDVLADNGLPGDSSRIYLKPTYQASIDLTERWFGDPRNTVGVGLFSHRSSAPGIYVDNGYGASISFTRNVQPRTPLSLVYRYELTQVEAGDVYFCVNYGVCEQNTIGLLRNRNALSPVSLDFYMDRTNDEFNPSDGYSARADLEHASKYTLSDFRYNRASGEATYFRPFGKAVLAGHLRGGWVHALSSTNTSDVNGLDDILHPRKRFYAGGANSVRGYGENQLGPRILTIDPKKLGCTTAQIANGSCDPSAPRITTRTDGTKDTTQVTSSDFNALPTGGTSLLEGSIEYRFPFVMKNLQAAVFIDAGYVGSGSSDVTKGKAAVTPGFGVRYLSPVGPIRVDLGFRPSVTDKLTVISEVVDPDGTHRLVQLEKQREYNPIEDGSGISKVLNHFALHLSIGQAF
jgi:outer membrane protein insertion porin family/translocation and assembly module TamA